MPTSRPKTWYVYTYAYPDGTLFYIGKGLRSRINSHEHEAETDCPCEKCCIIRRIWASDNPVQKRIVFETLTESEALSFEAELIKKSDGLMLTNVIHNPSRKTKSIDQAAMVRLSEEIEQITVEGEVYVPFRMAIQIFGCKEWEINHYLNLLNVRRYQFSRDRKTYILKDDVERIKELLDQSSSR